MSRNRAMPFLAFLIVLLQCQPASAQEADQKVRVELNSISLKKLDLLARTADAIIIVDIHNPGAAFRIKDVRYRLKVNGVYLAIGRLDEQLRVPGQSTATMEVPLTVDLASIPGATVGAISDGFRIRYVLEAEFTVPFLGLFSRRVRTNFDGEMTLTDALSDLPSRVRERIGTRPW